MPAASTTGANRRGLGLGGLAAPFEVGQALLVGGPRVDRLDHTHRRLRRLGRRRIGRARGLGGRCASGKFDGCLLDCRLGTRLGFVALALLLSFAQALLLGQIVLLAAQQLGMTARFLCAPREFGLVDDGRRRRGGLLGSRRLVTLDEGALLADLDLDRACLAGRIGLLDFARALARDADLLAFAGRRRAVAGAQVLEQAFLVAIGQRIVGRLLRQASRLQLVEQCGGRPVQLGSKLCDGGHSHFENPWWA